MCGQCSDSNTEGDLREEGNANSSFPSYYIPFIVLRARNSLSAFIHKWKKDIGMTLQQPLVVNYREDMRLFTMGQDLATRYEAFERETTERVVRMLDDGDPSGLFP